MATDTNRKTDELSSDMMDAWGVMLPELVYQPVPDGVSPAERENRPIWRIRLEMVGQRQRQAGYDILGEVIFGRDSSDANVVDLQEFGAVNMGVSRHHLMLRPTATHLYAIDLGSTNGTLRNGRSIGVNTPYALADGDILTLGQLRLVLHIVERPHYQTGLLERKGDLADSMTQIAKSITSQLDLDQVLSQVVDAAMSLTAAGETSIWLVDETSGELFLEAQRGIEDEAIHRLRLPIDGDSLVGKVIQSGRPLRVWRQPGEDQIKVKTNYLVEALAYVPITLGGVTFGVLAATHRQPGKRFDRRDERLLTAIADFAAIAIQNARVYHATDAALARRYKELSALNELSRALNASLDLDRVYEVLVGQMNRHWPVEWVRLCLLDENGQRLIPFLTKHKDTRPFDLREGIIGCVVREGTPIMSNDPSSHPAYHPPVDNVDGQIPHSVLSVPLRIQTRVVGALALFNKADGPFTKEDVNRLETFANPVATAIENARLFKESEQRRAAIQATANTLPQPLLILDNNGAVLIANQSANELMQTHMAALFAGIRRGVGRTAEVPIGEQTFLTTAEHLPDVGTIVVMQDITYVKQLERDRSEFLHMLSHDLKNPLTAITGWKELIERTVELDNRSQRYLSQIGVAVERMLDMIAHLLATVTQETAVNLVRQELDFDALVSRVLNDTSGVALAKNITVRCATEGEPYPILADEARLYHMTLNLVDNAIKYSPRKTEVTVRVTYKGEWIEIQVQDQGPGIPNDELKQVFNKYFRGATAKMQPGSGLGLSVVWGIVKAHDGQVSVANRPEGGAEFTIRLPTASNAIA
jgi:two-component system, OmpR family, phosphate regulon sensor histidine kinase PhoR